MNSFDRFSRNYIPPQVLTVPSPAETDELPRRERAASEISSVSLRSVYRLSGDVEIETSCVSVAAARSNAPRFSLFSLVGSRRRFADRRSRARRFDVAADRTARFSRNARRLSRLSSPRGPQTRRKRKNDVQQNQAVQTRRGTRTSRNSRRKSLLTAEFDAAEAAFPPA